MPAAACSTSCTSTACRTGAGQDELRAVVPEITHLDLAELLSPTLTTELGRSLTRARVQQYQRYFADADRVLILLHNEPDPDALAAGLALRNVLRRTRTTAIIGAMQGITRPENLRMADLLDIQVETIDARRVRRASIASRPWTCSRTTSAACCRASIWSSTTIPSSRATRRSSRTSASDYGSTCTILTEHLRAVDVNISERTATAMLYAIKSDTLFFARQTNRVDLEAFSFLYPLADPALIRKMEGAEITLERLEHVTRALATSRLRNQVFSAFLGETHARGLHPLHRRLPAAGRGREVDDRRRASSAASSSSACATSATRATPASS